MLPVIPKPPLTPGQKKVALIVAGIIDLLQIAVFPLVGLDIVLDEALDVIAAVVLTAICGFKWQFALAFAFELLPVADLLPTWTAVVLLMGATTPEVSASHAAPPPTMPRLAGQPPVARKDDDVVDVEVVTVPPVQPVAPAQPPTLPHAQ